MVKILIYEPYVFKVYGNTGLIGLYFKLLDKKRFQLILVSPKQDILINIIKKLGGRCAILSPPKILKHYGGSILKKGIFYKILVGLAIVKYNVNLISFIIKEKVDIVQCHNLRSLLTVGWAAKFTRKPCIWYIKGLVENKILARIGFILADKILFLNQALKNRVNSKLIEKYEYKIDILRIGIDLDEITKIQLKNKKHLEIKFGISKENFNIAFLGVIAPYKGLNYLIQALAEVKRKISNIKLYIVGDHAVKEYKSFKADLEKIIDKECLNENVVFTGWRADAREILSLMDIYVLPSLSEGVPRSIVEAMALGKPVVATDVGGVKETVIDGETGFVVKPRDVKALADAIIKLAKDKELRKRFGKRAKEIAFREYSIKTHIAKLEKIYLGLLKDKKNCRLGNENK